MDRPFLNEARTRYYGVRVGDRVRLVVNDRVRDGEVIALEPMDNNRVAVEWDNGGRAYEVAEWLIVLIPVETWFAGKQGDSIVTKDPFGMPPTSQESLDFYGGYLIAESIPPPFIPIILAAPAMLKALEMFEKLENNGDITIWSDKRETMNKALRIVRERKKL